MGQPSHHLFLVRAITLPASRNSNCLFIAVEQRVKGSCVLVPRFLISSIYPSFGSLPQPHHIEHLLLASGASCSSATSPLFPRVLSRAAAPDAPSGLSLGRGPVHGTNPRQPPQAAVGCP